MAARGQSPSLSSQIRVTYQTLINAADKYTTFSPHDRGYRKSVHKVPKWTKVSSLLHTPWLYCWKLTMQLTLRENPKGF